MNKPYEEIRALATMEGSEGLLAIIVRANYVAPTNGATFFTSSEMPQQLGILSHPKGTTIPVHTHKHFERKTDVTQEVLIVRRGKLSVTFYTSKGDKICERILSSGDIVLLASGGHGFEAIEDVDMIEVKSGPYAGSGDKRLLFPRG